uniref:G-protein coupled receptors family 1 profile domain-containing protein n=1 Tax=Latimeria chalumnae TaxID=7897 RepID=H3AZ20_LATCH
NFSQNGSAGSPNVALTGFCGESVVTTVLQSYTIIMYPLSLLLNLLLVFSIIISKQMAKPMYVFMLNLAITDIIGCTAGVITIFPMLITKSNYFFKEFCFFQGFLVYLFAGALSGAVTTMAIDRYVAICNPLLYICIFKKTRTVIILISSWLVTIVMAFVYMGLSIKMISQPVIIRGFLCEHLSISNVMNPPSEFNFIFNIATILALIIVSFCLQYYTYNQIFNELRNFRDAELAQNSKYRLARHLFLPIATYLLGFIMYGCSIVDHFICNPYVTNIKVVTQALYYTAVPALNPIVYGLNISELRKHLLCFMRKHASPYC